MRKETAIIFALSSLIYAAYDGSPGHTFQALLQEIQSPWPAAMAPSSPPPAAVQFALREGSPPQNRGTAWSAGQGAAYSASYQIYNMDGSETIERQSGQDQDEPQDQ